MHHPKENQNARSSSAAAADTSHSGNTIIMAAVYNAPPKALIAPPKIPAVALADIKPKADLLNQRFILEGDETPVGIDLEEEQCTLVIGDARLRIVSTKDENGKVQKLDKNTVQKYRESCHLRRTKKGVRAYGVIIPWLWEPSFELSDVELNALKEKTIAALKEKDPKCANVTITLQRGEKNIDVILEYQPPRMLTAAIPEIGY